VDLASFKIERHEIDDLVAMMMGSSGFFLFMPLIIPFCNLIYFLLSEKELKIKETMKIMGLTDSAYFLSWIIQYGLIFTSISFLVTCIVVITVAQNSNFFFIFFWHWIFSMTFLSKAFLIA
jgi:ATP-binding cassette subfamily A (ABC1) protein 3